MFSKKKTIVLDLYDQYRTQEELSEIVVHDLKERGNQCQKVDYNTVLVNDKTYSVTDRVFPICGFIVHQAVLKQIQ
ncbi:hypothetical protein [Neobacillus sp. SAB-20_R2A]|uniref:hypothetical protein n=1 Tax=Neobacillus sp. SAB-20_R2A TaxID=3120519 RepID=UPI003C6E29C8